MRANRTVKEIIDYNEEKAQKTKVYKRKKYR